MLTSVRQWSVRRNEQNATDNLSVDSAESVNSSKDDQRMSPTLSDSISETQTSIDSSNSVLGPDELSKVAELRERLGAEVLAATPLFDDDLSLWRWISGWNGKWSEIISRFLKASNILECLGANELDFEDPDSLNEYIRGLYPACDYFTGGLMGYDKEGNPIVVQCVGKIYPKLLVHCGRVSDVFRLSVLEASSTLKLIKKQEKKLGKQLGIVLILDLEGLCMDHVVPQTIKVYMNLLRLLQDMFPETAQKIYIINAPSMFASAYSLVKPAIAEKSRQKVQVLSSAYAETLFEELGADNIYSFWQGSKVANRGEKTTGTLRMGGVPPENLRYTAEGNKHHAADSDLTRVVVRARNSHKFDVDCKAGQRLRWFFHTNGDIDFSVHFGDQLVVPRFRLHTDYVPEYNSVIAKETGTYTIIFDNSFSTFFSKEVRFTVVVDDVE
ncbi:Cellular retinaldehyde-binding triple function domain containing protein [Aphelenchoides besseyi]|nr:Cellular retinaldehyde-binding triple function domain containing protein [Aphelenchoides besseyi]KAI6207364.1 Cellular retinaldehyde-binding triple function domain containing protein [Aphelenchoides besseyi]